MKRPESATPGQPGPASSRPGSVRPGSSRPKPARSPKPAKAAKQARSASVRNPSARPPNERPSKVRKVVKAGASRAGSWLGGIRITGVTVLIVVLFTGGVLILAPQLKTLVDQRQQIADLQAKNDAANAQIAEIDKQRARWDDPAYIRAQARERLYYVMPGEISYLVVNDVNIPDIKHEQVSAAAQQKNKDWLSGLFASFMVAGLSTEPPATPAPSPAQ